MVSGGRISLPPRAILYSVPPEGEKTSCSGNKAGGSIRPQLEET
jgi:hypothetical protein